MLLKFLVAVGVCSCLMMLLFGVCCLLFVVYGWTLSFVVVVCLVVVVVCGFVVYCALVCVVYCVSLSGSCRW